MITYNIWEFGKGKRQEFPESDLYMQTMDQKGNPVSFPIGDSVLNGNLLVLGTTRTGKTSFLRSVCKKLRQQYPQALFVFFDVKKDYIPLYQNGDYVFSYYHPTSGDYIPFQWSLVEEALHSKNPYDEIRELVNVLFADMDCTGDNSFFYHAAKQIFIAYCKTFIYLLPDHFTKKDVPSNKDIIQLYQSLSYHALCQRIKCVKSQVALCDSLLPACPDGRPTKQASSVLAVLNTFLPIFSGNFCSAGRDSIYQFLKQDGKALFLEYDYSRQAGSSGFFRVILKHLIQQKLSGNTDKNKKVFLILDESAMLNGDFDLAHALNVGAGCGLRIILAAQSIEHLYMQAPAKFSEHYGAAIKAGFANVVAFRPNDENTIEAIQEKFGKGRVNTIVCPIDRYQHAQIESVRDYIVTSEELMELGIGDAYVKIKGQKPQRIHFPEE